MEKLSKTQQELLDAIKAGARVTYIAYSLGSGPYYIRRDLPGFPKCTPAAQALFKKGLVERVNQTARGFDLRAKEA